ncbi:MAG: 2-phosphosulfolactate phosphatase [Ignavibacteriae bacterium]|jgi:2-phosphosulfolactate phosphatase|nr:2-phosphosulfolactate phosphatase [Ignavibacteriota bacterium]NOG96916.1 2-phosphosulfolactate phosphatase [Ignavibacteriota bacterium]
MKINVLLSPNNADELYFTGKNTVVIDVLRASTVIVNALNNNAKEVIPVDSVDFALKVSGGAFSGQTLLGGERNTIKIDGFDLGNSPEDYSEELVAGKTVIIYTTNGSKAIVKSKYSEKLIVGCFNNLKAVAEYFIKLDEDFEILCSGSNGKFCIEDTVCAGKIIEMIEQKIEGLELTDSASAALILSKSFNSIKEMMINCEHGKKLIENGFEKDIDYCAKLNTISTIPFYNSGLLKLIN